MMNLISIAVGATLGAWFRWFFGILFNPLFPTIPLGTLFANLLGCYLIGVGIALFQHIPTMPQFLRLGFITGFLGSFTTFSTFTAETVDLISSASYLGVVVMIGLHVGGGLLLTVTGMYTIKLIFGV